MSQLYSMEFDLDSKQWWSYLDADIKELLKQSLLLLELMEARVVKQAASKKEFHDYAFLVFPAAKAYEGFLKNLFLDMGFISKEDYYGKHFRVGKALNPALEKKFRSESVYDKVLAYCGGRQLPDTLWETWKSGRNLIFHWFPNERNAIDLAEARVRIEGIISAIDFAFSECRIELAKQA